MGDRIERVGRKHGKTMTEIKRIYESRYALRKWTTEDRADV